MSALTLRLVKGSALTWSELDDNFINLNTDKYESGDNAQLGTLYATTYTNLPGFNDVQDGIVPASGGGTDNFLRADGTWQPAGGGAAIDTDFTPAGTIAATNVQDAIEELDSETQAALNAITGGLGGGDTGIGTYLVSGASIAWQEDLIYRVGAANYFIDGTAVTSTEQTVTLDAADPTLDRIDVLVLDATGTLSAITGTPSADPAESSIDPAVYLRLGIVYVQAATTEPSITQTDIYLDNAEWTATASAGTINVDSTNNPRSGTKDIEGTSVAANTYVTLVKPAAGTTDLATQNSLVFFVRVKAAWPAAKAIRLGWYSGTALRGSQVTVSNGLFGFNSATVGSYQQIVVPISAFNMPAGNLVTTLRMTIIGGGTTVGFYIDDIVLVSGATTIPSLTASRALVSNVSGNVAASVVTATELGYVSGVTSALQTQINAKAALAGATFTGPVITVLSGTGAAGFRLPHGAAPTAPTNGDFWSTTSGFYGYVNGVTVGPFAAGGYTFSATAPSSPAVGDRWVSSTEGVLYTYVDDGSSSQWVDFSASVGASASAIWGNISGTLSDQTDLQTELTTLQTNIDAVATQGSWTPAIAGTSTGTFGGVTSYGRWTRIGNSVFIHGNASWTSVTGPWLGGIAVSGLPVAVGSQQSACAIRSVGVLTITGADEWIGGYFAASSSNILISTYSTAGGTTGVNTPQASGTVSFSGSYEV